MSACRPRGFTFIEMLVALAILSSAFAIIAAIFTGSLNAWRRGSEELEQLHHGDFVMEQLVQSMRSSAFFTSSPQFYEFRLEKGNADGNPADRMSWVTSSAAFMPLDSPYAHGLQRVEVAIERAARGVYGFQVTALPHLILPEDVESNTEIESWFVSTRIKGLRCRIFNDEDGRWEDTWELTNAIPSLIEVTLYVEPAEPNDPPLRMQRAITIPIAPVVTSRVDFVEE
jgi:prepilin-type N-terminal cleavage/methylation domain-containing protein